MSVKNAQKMIELENQIKEYEKMIIEIEDLTNELNYKKHKIKRRIEQTTELLRKM